MKMSMMPAEHTVTTEKMQHAKNAYPESGENQTEEISYEYVGYHVRIHFNGDKTLKQCIRNLIERKTEADFPSSVSYQTMKKRD